jgi:hypothetical protein
VVVVVVVVVVIVVVLLFTRLRISDRSFKRAKKNLRIS